MKPAPKAPVTQPNPSEAGSTISPPKLDNLSEDLN